MGERTAIQRFRCPIFLLQLLSTILKSERGASHPERSKRASAPRVANNPGDNANEAFAANDDTCCGWEREAAQTCAKVAATYIGRMIGATTTLMLGRRNLDPINDHFSGSLDVADVGFWVFALSSDVLKHVRKSKWSYAESTSLTRCKRQRGDETRGNGAEAAGVVVSNDNGCGSSERGVSGVLDVPGLAEVVAAFPVGSGTGTMDVALKWLEVTQASIFLLVRGMPPVL